MPEGISEEKLAVDEANLIVQANSFRIKPDQLRRLKNFLSQGAVGIPSLRQPDWMMQAVRVAREIGEEKAKEIAGSLFHTKFSPDVTFPQVLEQLPDLYRRLISDEGKFKKIPKDYKFIITKINKFNKL